METIVFKVKTKEFVKTLGVGGAMAGKNRTIPVLDTIKIELSADSLFVSSFNGEVGVSCVCDCERVSGEDFSFLAMGSDIVPYVRTIKDEELTIELGEKSYTVRHSKGYATFSFLDAGDFPTIPALGGNMDDDECSVSFLADGGTLGNMMSQASSFVSNDMLRPVMGGVLVTVEGGRLSLAASDSHKLYINSFDVRYDGEKRSVVVPLSAVGMICTILTEGEDASVSVGEKYISVTSGGASVSSSLIIGKYPNVAAVVPTTFEQSVDVSVPELSEVINRLLVVSNKATNAMKVEVNAFDGVKVSAEDLGASKCSSESVFADSIKGNVVFGVKGSLLLQCLKVIDTEKARFGMNGGRKAIALNEIGGNDNKTVIVMPLAIG